MDFERAVINMFKKVVENFTDEMECIKKGPRWNCWKRKTQ